MHQRRHWRQLLVALTAALAVVGSPDSAEAFLDDGPATRDTAYTLGEGEFRLSLWELDYGVTDRLQLGTVHLLDAFGIFNAGVKYRFWTDGPVALSARLEVVQLDFQRWPFNSAAAGQIIAVPVEFSGSWRWADAWTLHGGALFTKVVVSGSPDEDTLQGAAGVDNLQTILGLHWMLSRSWALYAQSQHLVVQTAGARIDVTLTIDEKTTAHLVAEGESDAVDFGGANSLLVGGIYSGESFNMRAGIGGGNWSLPVINFVVPNKGLILDLDIYWRF